MKKLIEKYGLFAVLMMIKIITFDIPLIIWNVLQ